MPQIAYYQGAFRPLRLLETVIFRNLFSRAEGALLRTWASPPEEIAVRDGPASIVHHRTH
jgi:hypothetical protein